MNRISTRKMSVQVIGLIIKTSTHNVRIEMKVIYTNFLIPKRFDAYNLIIVCLIRPEFKNDNALYEHELTHNRQWKREPFTYPFKYLFSKPYRYKMELEAYTAQLRLYPLKKREEKSIQFARLICTHYGIKGQTEESTKNALIYNLIGGKNETD